MGGEYEDVSFSNLLVPEKHGPFSYDEALIKWRDRSWSTVDNCHNRYEIVKCSTVIEDDIDYFVLACDFKNQIHYWCDFISYKEGTGRFPNYLIPKFGYSKDISKAKLYQKAEIDRFIDYIRTSNPSFQKIARMIGCGEVYASRKWNP